MARDEKNGLSHHEELRYFYLLRNLNYLSENEMREYRYLKAKMEATISDRFTSYPYKPETQRTFENQRFRDFSASDHYQGTQSVDATDNNQAYQPEETFPSGLPIYPDKPSMSRSSKRHQRFKREEAVAPEMFEAETSIHQTYENLDTSRNKKNKKPKKKGKLKRNLKFLGFILMVLIAGVIFMFAKGYFDISTNKAKYKPAVTETFNGVDTKNGTNILILGSDQRVTQKSDDARTDTIMVLNVGNKDKKVKMVSFMRDTLVNIPGYSYNNSDSYDLKLNSSFNFGEQDGHKGAEMVRKTLKHNFDIDVKYYMMVDFETFAEAIDTLFPDGVKINAKFATISGEAVNSVKVPDDLRMKNGVVPDQTIKVGEQRMDGRTLLNYARFRKDDDGDYGRTVRQQQVMTAVMSQVKDPVKLFTGSAAIGKLYALTSTNVPSGFILQKGLTSLTSGAKVEHVTIPAQGDWVDEFDMYGGQALYIDFAKYQKKLSKMGLR
ncbi:LCP family protein [Streptococcus porcinus]|uniref:Regulatory protein MsrR n=2 Tax=Streptococcus porcinus TaxID=1340 RepID=A0A4V0H368_STRPO|nr:LCP family protein [Streptococcus porcinus]EGJ27020.1 cell envelope-like function transcriptional attenuator common domain protein [Streptococcus porcinus str. Jelinkova 176]SQG43430.1 cell envelope-related transcriptional attenuator domain-containing protein [Streptococcus porcinus]VTT42705.1 cell envelope-related transcriptional attenuator domain-containing protein [Streptococcus porcinus]VTT44137.1 cell envelope-related transcriptional attenuator domain-containing protein [Streptococcus p